MGRDDVFVALTRTQAREETHRLGHVRLYRDELETIIRAVAEIGEPTIEGPGFTATSEKDLADPAVPEKLDWLTITASRDGQQLRVRLSGTSAVVELTEPTMLLYGVASRVSVICQRYARFWKRAQPPGVDSPELLRRQKRMQRMVGGLPVFAAGPLDLWAWRRLKSSARLVNAYRVDRPTFWQRKRDDLFINAASLALGGVIGYIVNELTT